jgi:hypothetical protein
MTNPPGRSPGEDPYAWSAARPEAEPAAEARPLEAAPADVAAEPAVGTRHASLRGYVVTVPAFVLALVATAVTLMFVLVEPSPRWVVLFGTAVTTFGLDGVLRSGRRQPFAEGGLDTAPLLLVPALYVLTMPVFVEHATLGLATPFAALGVGAGYGALVVGELSSVREFDVGRLRGRFIAAAATYIVAFALFALVFLFGVGQRSASIAVGLSAMLLAAEILREGEIDAAETLLYSLVAGLVVAETRWLLHYLPIDAYAGALTLLLAFYLVTGVLHSHVVRQLTREVEATYAGVGLVGVALVAVARAAGIA